MRLFESTFVERLSVGISSEKAFEKFASNNQLTVVFVSTHRDTPRSKIVRHFPDYFVVEWAAFVQVKNGKNSGNYSDVIAEKSSIDACKYLHKNGSKVMIVWEMPDGCFMGNWIEKLDTSNEISGLARKNGSGTPAYKISKSSLKAL